MPSTSAMRIPFILPKQNSLIFVCLSLTVILRCCHRRVRMGVRGGSLSCPCCRCSPLSSPLSPLPFLLSPLLSPLPSLRSSFSSPLSSFSSLLSLLSSLPSPLFSLLSSLPSLLSPPPYLPSPLPSLLSPLTSSLSPLPFACAFSPVGSSVGNWNGSRVVFRVVVVI